MNTPERIGYLSLVEFWSEGRRKSRSSSLALRIILGYGFLILPIVTAVLVWKSFHAKDYFTLIWILLSSLPAVWAIAAFWKKWKHAKDENIFSGTVVPASPGLQQHIWKMFSNEAMCIGIDKAKLRIFVKTDRLDVNLGVFESKKSISIFTSLGFTKLVYSDEPCAKAMLLHELAHVMNADSKLWTIVNIFYSVHLRILLPATLALTLISAIIGLVGLHKVSVTRDALKLESAKAEAQLEAQQKMRSQLNPLDFSAELGKTDVMIEYDKRDDELESLKERILLGFSQLLLVPFGIGFIYLAIKSARRNSERLADASVSLFQAGPLLRLAVEKYGVEVQRSNLMDFLVEFHPGRFQRLNELDQDAEVLGATSKDAPVLRKLRTLKRRNQLLRKLKFSSVIGGIFAAVPAFLLLTEDRNGDDSLLERIGMCLFIFLTLALVSLVAYSIVNGLSGFATRKRGTEFPWPKALPSPITSGGTVTLAS